MARSDKLLEAMRGNPNADWSIDDVCRLARAHGIACAAPRRGSHYKLSHPGVIGILTVPARRPIKPIYIELVVQMVDGLAHE